MFTKSKKAPIVLASFALFLCPLLNIVQAAKPFAGQELVATAYAGPYYDAIKKIIVAKFEADTGATVRLEPSSGDELAIIGSAPADAPPFDVIAAWSPDFIRGIAEELFLPLRLENIPNFKDLSDFHKGDHGIGLDTSYGVPFEYAFMGLFYNKEALGFAPTDWKDLWRPEAQGKIGFNTSFWPVWLVPVALGVDQAPGVEELYSDEGIDAVIARLKKLDVAVWGSNAAEVTAALSRGDIALVAEGIEAGSPLVFEDPDKYGFVLPEGVVGFIDYWVVVRGTKKRDLAEAFLNYLIDPELQAKWAEEIPYWMSNKNVKYGSYASTILPPTHAEREAQATMIDWKAIMERYGEIDERLRKEVYTQ